MYNDIYHHGILGMHWGIRRFQPYPKGSSSKGKFIGKRSRSDKASAKASSLNRRADKKFTKYDKKIAKKQKKADIQFEKAQRKSQSIFSSQKSVNKAVAKATKSQRKVNRLEYKGKKYYTKVSKKLNKLNKDIDPSVKQRGENYMNKVTENSRLMYTSISTGGSMRYKYR